MESEGNMTATDARGWINALIKAMHEETSGSWPDPEYKDEVYSALEMAIRILENHDTFMKYAYSYGKAEALSQEPCTDAVSRQAVLEKQYRIDDSATLSTRDVVNVDDIEELPSVNPQYTGNEFFNFDAPIVKKSMEQDAISREMVLNLCMNNKYNMPYEYEDDKGILHRGYDEYRLINYYKLKLLPSVTPSRHKGHWILKQQGDRYADYCCSECGNELTLAYCTIKDEQKKGRCLYCDHCGAKMESEVQE